MSMMHGIPTFIDTAAVEAWDAWFRWRERERLHDTTIEATWARVATALADADPGQTPERRRRYVAALSSWRLLPDEHIIATAGTPSAHWQADNLVAVINVPMFVRDRFSPLAGLDMQGIAATADTAVQFLDDASCGCTDAGQAPKQLRIGFTGVSDALVLLGLAYGSIAAQAVVSGLGRTLSHACFGATVRLARERGAHFALTGDACGRAVKRGIPAATIRDAERHGLRHARLTALTSQPRLSLLANNVADALDPILGIDRIHSFPPHGHTVQSPGYALRLAGDKRLPLEFDRMIGDVTTGAQLAMRSALQPWMDEPIAYPLLVSEEPALAERRAIQQQATMRGLAAPTWRLVDA
jgi:ribonucleoside-diphosphate reductase alpha chain